MRIKTFLLQSKNVERDSYLWNTMGGLLRGFRSVVFLMILSRTVGLVMAGIFSIANANSNLFLHMGNYNMRTFQVSDVRREYTFKEYLTSRFVTIGAMIAISAGYALFAGWNNAYTWEKIWILIWMCLYKVADALEDVFFGEFQRKGRMDIGAKIMTVRLLFTMIVFAGLVIFTKDLLLTIILSTLLTMLALLVFLWCARSELVAEAEERSVIENIAGQDGIQDTAQGSDGVDECRMQRVAKLLRVCFPVFVSGFLSFYISNAAKYAIDGTLPDEYQGWYGFISMPVLVIGMLNGFIFNPTLYALSKAWSEGEIGKYVKKAGLLLLAIAGITLGSVGGAYFLGVPVLSLLFGEDLSRFKWELLLLLVAAGFTAASDFMAAMITIMRRQRMLLYGYGCTALLALLLAKGMVLRFQMMGAALLFTLLEVCLCLFFVVIIIYGLCKHEKIER